MFAFTTQEEFNQASLENTARMIADHASQQVINLGNIADVSEELLEHLAYIAKTLELSPFTIGVYHEVILEQNNELREFEEDGKFLSKSLPTVLNKGLDFNLSPICNTGVTR